MRIDRRRALSVLMLWCSPAVAVGQTASSETLFLDVEGLPTAVVLESSRAYVRVVDSSENRLPSSVEVTSATILVTLTGDSESLGLTETGPDTGVFERSSSGRRRPETSRPSS